MTAQAKKAKKSKTYLILIGISVTYIFIYYLLMKETELCDATTLKIRDQHGFWDQYLACRSINELGDALAGAFAPVAFIWLAGTVFIQSKELEAQRQELDETQEVMREQLEVAKEQVKETKASTELFTEQTNILKRQQELREQEIADQEFDAAVKGFATMLSRHSSLSTCYAKVLFQSKNAVSDALYHQAVDAELFSPVPNQDCKWMLRPTNRYLFSGKFTQDLPMTCRELRSAAQSLFYDWNKGDDDEFYLISSATQAKMIDGFNAIKTELEHLQLLSPRLSNAKRYEFEACEIEKTLNSMDSVSSWATESGRLRDDFISKGMRFATQTGPAVNPPPGTTPV